MHLPTIRSASLALVAGLCTLAIAPHVAFASGSGVVASTESTPDGAIEAIQRWCKTPRADRPELSQQPWASVPLSAEEASLAAQALWATFSEDLRADRLAEWDAKSITLGEHTMRFETRTFGEKPASGRSMFISMHGGGNARPAVNDQQWKNQIGLYEPAEGVYIAPRAPTNTWNLWHESHIDPLFDRLIQDAVLFADVNPDRVYLMGYSAGGDGVYQLAPRMADRFAAAAMMAGHPNEASPLSLRNLPFSIQVGEKDTPYRRNEIAKEWGDALDKLRAANGPDSYPTFVEIHAGKGHWMNRDDAKAVPWMAQFTRNAWPKDVVWRQDDVTHSRLYWLATDREHEAAGLTVIAGVADGQITVREAPTGHPITFLLSDRLMNLDASVRIVLAGDPEVVLFEGPVQRTAGSLWASLADARFGRGDASMMYSATVRVQTPFPQAPDSK